MLRLLRSRSCLRICQYANMNARDYDYFPDVAWNALGLLFFQIVHNLSVEILDVYIIKCGYKSGNRHNPRTNNLLRIYSFINCIMKKTLFLSLEIQVHKKIKLKIIILSRNKTSRWFLFVFKIDRGKQIVVLFTNFSVKYFCTICYHQFQCFYNHFISSSHVLPSCVYILFLQIMLQ